MYPIGMLLEVTVDGTSVVGPMSVDHLRRAVDSGQVPPVSRARPLGTATWSPIAAFLQPAAANDSAPADPPREVAAPPSVRRRAAFSERLRLLHAAMRDSVESGKAVRCATRCTVDGSADEGSKLLAEQAKLMLMAFDAECGAAIAMVRRDNAVSLEQRLERSFGEINALGASRRLELARSYFDLKLAELRLVLEERER